MPVYEYTCPECSGRFQKLVQGFSDPTGLACPRCGNRSVQRAVSRFATIRSEETRIESLADPSTFADLDESDPRAIARWAKRMGKELGEDAGDDWDETVDALLEEELDDDGTATPRAKAQDDLGWG